MTGFFIAILISISSTTLEPSVIYDSSRVFLTKEMCREHITQTASKMVTVLSEEEQDRIFSLRYECIYIPDNRSI